MINVYQIIITGVLFLITGIATLSLFILKDIKQDLKSTNDRLVDHISNLHVHTTYNGVS